MFWERSYFTSNFFYSLLLQPYLPRWCFHICWQFQSWEISKCMFCLNSHSRTMGEKQHKYLSVFANRPADFISYVLEISRVLKFRELWVVVSCRLGNSYRSCERSWCLPLQSKVILVECTHFTVWSCTKKHYFIETSVTAYRSTQRNISEDLNLQQHRSGNLESRTLVFFEISTILF